MRLFRRSGLTRDFPLWVNALPGRKYAELREQYKQLSEHQRRQVRQQMHDDGQQRTSARIHQYFELPKAQRVAYLDQQINEMEKRRKQTSGRDSGPKGGGVRGSGPTPRERGKSMSDADRQERRDRFKRSRLDGSTPRQRAELAEYFDALRKRREQRGLPDSHRRGPQGSRVNVG